MDSVLTTFNGSVSGLSFTEKLRLVFCRTLQPMFAPTAQGVWKHCQYGKLDGNAFYN